MKQKWVINKKAGDVYSVAREQNIEPITARILLNRELGSKEERDMYLHPSFEFLRSPYLMLNAKEAAERLQLAIEREQRIRVIGDYDVDGITSTYVLYTSLRSLGAEVSYKIPHRVLDGYGINKNMVDECEDDGIDLIITCDNGISEFETIAYAKEKGMDVILTDHHEIPRIENETGEFHYEMPEADIIVNPHQPGETYPFSGFCGCVVAMKVVECMGVDIKKLMPYAAMATLCDVMELRDENRVIVSLGLAEMRRSTDIGLNALIEANNIEKDKIGSYHVGFIIGPCLNATGRLDTAELALKLLMETDEQVAANLATNLVELNVERKAMTEEGVNAAIAQIEGLAKEKAVLCNAADEGIANWEDYVDPVLCVYLPEVHESIAGIIAGRVRERFHRPTFILTDSGEYIKGSGRSIEAYSMYEELSRVRELFVRFGGHPMAAGLSLERERLDEMRQSLNENAILSDDDLTKKTKIDAKVPFNLVNIKLINELSRLEPFGKGNEKPVLADSNLSVEGIRVLGKNRNVIKLNLSTEADFCFEALYFCEEKEFRKRLVTVFGEEEMTKAFAGRKNNIKLSITYYPDVNEYNGITTLQAKITDIMM